MTDAGYDLSGGTVWFSSSMDKHGEAIGATVDAERVNLGEDGAFSTNIMAKMAVTRHERDESASCYLARTFGPTVEEARDGLSRLLSSPERLEVENESWWNTYLNDVPQLETPDESLSKTFLWSWPDFRMSQIDVPVGPAPPGFFRAIMLASVFALTWLPMITWKPEQLVYCTIRNPLWTCCFSYSKRPGRRGF